MTNSTFVSTELDSYVSIYADANPIWMVTLSNGESVYQDDDRPDVYPESAWARLKIYCEENDLHITDMKIRNKGNVQSIESNCDGYFFCKGAGAFLFGGETVHSFVIGILKDNTLHVRKWRLPELIFEMEERRDPSKSPESLIVKKGILSDQQKL